MLYMCASRLCQNKMRRRERGALACSRGPIYASRARHSANAVALLNL
jgi:hypothetical protein